MKRCMVLAGFVSAMAITSGVAGDPKAAGDSKSGPECKLPPPNADARLEPFKKLAGAWQASDEDKDGKPDGDVFYRVISNGSAIAEFLAPGTEYEMVSLYHLDNNDVVMTHYCAAGNQPRLKAKPYSPSDKEITFEFKDATNLRSPDDMHISGLVLTIVDDDHVIASWRGKAGGKDTDHTVFKLTRVKDSSEAAKIAAKVTTPAPVNGAKA